MRQKTNGKLTATGRGDDCVSASAEEEEKMVKMRSSVEDAAMELVIS